MLSQGAGYTLIIINGIVLLLIAFFSNKVLNKNAGDYFAAGHKVKWPLLSSSIVIVFAYASTLLVAAEGAYLYGWPAIWMYALSGMSLIFMIPFFKKIKRILPKGTTIPEFLLEKFGVKVHLISSVISIYLMIMVLLYTFTGLGTGLSPLFGIPYHLCVIISGVVIIIYSLLGGLWGSIITDFFQHIIVWVIVAIAAIIVVQNVGGFESIYSNLVSRNLDSGTALYTKDAMINYGSFMILGYFTYALIDQTILQRVFAIDDSKNVAKMMTVGFIGWSFLPMVAGLFGIVALAEGIDLTGSTSEVFPTVIREYAPVWLILAFAILVFNAIASTINSVLVGLSNLVTNDIYIRYLRRGKGIPPQQHLFWAKILVAVFGIVGILISLKPNSILSLGMYMTNFIIIGASPIITAFFMKKVHSNAIFISMLTGFILAIFISGSSELFGYKVLTWQINIFLYIVTASIVFIGSKLMSTAEQVDINSNIEQNLL